MTLYTGGVQAQETHSDHSMRSTIQSAFVDEVSLER